MTVYGWHRGGAKGSMLPGRSKAASSSSMIFSNADAGCAPLSKTPLTKKAGVPMTPAAVP